MRGGPAGSKSVHDEEQSVDCAANDDVQSFSRAAKTSSIEHELELVRLRTLGICRLARSRLVTQIVVDT